MKKRLISLCFPSFFLLLLFYLFICPEQAFQAASQGLNLWFQTLLPSLLPFCVLSNLLIASGIVPKLLRPLAPVFRIVFGLSVYGAYALCLGLLCGYPMGAKIVADLYTNGKIDETEGRYLLTFVNHASPMFVTSYIALHLFGNTDILPKTFFLLYSSAFLTSLIFRIWNSRNTKEKNVEAQSYALQHSDSSAKLTPITIDLVDDAIFNGFETITKLGGYIILFSIFSALLQQISTPFPMLQWLLPGLTELTTGIHAITQTAIDFEAKYIRILSLTAFGGISTIAQTKGMLKSTPFPISSYILGKITHALLVFALAVLFQIF